MTVNRYRNFWSDMSDGAAHYRTQEEKDQVLAYRKMKQDEARLMIFEYCKRVGDPEVALDQLRKELASINLGLTVLSEEGIKEVPDDKS